MDFRHELVLPNENLPFRLFVFEGKDGGYKVSKHWHRSIEIFLCWKAVWTFILILGFTGWDGASLYW
ncbi:hypothetical protein C823_006486 [Eubacterium plexicaudatum ASF492]|nr:hypothetical protein C823_006486 [Eubacterium plexicaudatum ASF492]